MIRIFLSLVLVVSFQIGLFSDECNHKFNQASININLNASIPTNRHLKPFSYYNLNNLTRFDLKRNKQSIKLIRSDEINNNRIYLNGSDLKDTNELVEIDFVWNMRNNKLHIVDSKQYPLEMHLINKNNRKNDFNIICILFEIHPNSTILNQTVNELKHKNSKSILMSLAFLKEIPLEQYFQYNEADNITCTSKWNIIKRVFGISVQQLYQIRKGFQKLKRNIQSKRVLKNVKLTRSFKTQQVTARKKRSPVETTSTTSSDNHAYSTTHATESNTTQCVRRQITTKGTTAAHHGRKKRNSASEDLHTTTSDPHSSSSSNDTNSTVLECVKIPVSDSDFVKFQILLVVLLSLFFVLTYLALNFCNKELCIRILNKIRKGSTKYIFRSLKKSDN